MRGPRPALLDSVGDHPLVDIAREVLSAEDFVVKTLELPDLAEIVVAAEDEYSLAAIVAADEWPQLSARIFPLDVALSNWVARHAASEKRWDVYLVCLLQSSLNDPVEFAEVERFESDTRRVRKYVRDGVLPEESDLRRALAPLLPLRLSVGRPALDPLAALEAKLRGRGIDHELAQIAVESFVETGEIRMP